jgi:cell division protein FtsQ
MLVKRLLHIIFWIALTVYFIVSMRFVSMQQRRIVCTDVEVNILDSMRSRFVTAKDIMQIADHPSQKLRGKLLNDINGSEMEDKLRQLSPIDRAEVYKTGDGTVHVDVLQRVPVLRVINRYGESYYLDETGRFLKHSANYYAHVPVANGHIDLRMSDERSGMNVSQIDLQGRNLLRELFDLTMWTRQHKFWNAQIQQLYVNADGDIELVPRVGAHVIIFGHGDKIEEKFGKLESLYRNGLNVTGWNKYDIINLKYDGQIVCTRRN